MGAQILLPKGVRPPAPTRAGHWKLVDTSTNWLKGSVTEVTRPDFHREKPMGIFVEAASPTQRPLFIPGMGMVWGEELKEIAARVQEKNEKFAAELEATKEQRTQAWRQLLSDHLDARMGAHRRNHRTDPAPNVEKLKGYF